MARFDQTFFQRNAYRKQHFYTLGIAFLDVGILRILLFGVAIYSPVFPNRFATSSQRFSQFPWYKPFFDLAFLVFK